MKRVFLGMVSRPSTMIALGIIVLVLILAVCAPWIAPYAPEDQPFDGLSPDGAPLPPSAQYWLGTDTLGRDLLSRLLFGARTSLLIGVVSNGVAVMIGMTVGIVAGYTAGFFGNLLMRFTDLMMAFPALLLAIVLAALLHPSLLDRGDGDRARQLGSSCAHCVYRNARLGGTRLYRSRKVLGRIPFPYSIETYCSTLASHRNCVGHARHSYHGSC